LTIVNLLKPNAVDHPPPSPPQPFGFIPSRKRAAVRCNDELGSRVSIGGQFFAFALRCGSRSVLRDGVLRGVPHHADVLRATMRNIRRELPCLSLDEVNMRQPTGELF
jgi:hypothetical protein